LGLRAVRRERDVDEVPVLVPQVVGITDVATSVRARWRLVAGVCAVVMIVGIALDDVRPAMMKAIRA